MPTSCLDFIALSLLPLRWWCEGLTRLRAGRPSGELLDQLLNERAAGRYRAPDLRCRAEQALARARSHGITPVPWDDAAYPAALAAIVDPPAVLWLRGSASILSLPSVAVVGSRAGSPYALQVAERLAADLAARGVVVVSGLARGVDSAAHRGALQTGVTVAVLGSGPDVVYPPEHEELAASIAAAGAVASEVGPGTPPQRVFFPRRNRIISGLSRAVVIVEAGEKSGSLITARCALEQGRDVLAVPGNVLNGRNRGGHALLRDGAKLVESADDILEELHVPAPSGGVAAGGQRADEPARRDAVLESLAAGEACDLDAVADRTGLAPARLLPRLFDLELRGLVRRIGGGRFVRVDRTC
jgi:DNA processing protein